LKDLLSISELAELLECSRETIKKRMQRGQFVSAVYIQRDQAIKLGLEWSSKAVRNPKGRPYVSINDPAIPEHVRKKYYELKLTCERSGSPSLPGEVEPLATAQPPIFHFPRLAKAPRPGKDTQSTENQTQAVGKNHTTGCDLLIIPPETPASRLPDSFEDEPSPAVGQDTDQHHPLHPPDESGRLPDPEIPVLPEGASLNAPGGAGSHTMSLTGAAITPPPGSSFELQVYAQLPDWARRQVDKYLPLVKKTEGMNRTETEKALSHWNSENPELAMSSRSLRLAKKRYREKGIAGLASKRGANAGRTIVRDEWLDYFQSLYLKEGAPSAYSCWLVTRGKFCEEKDFPVYQTFIYQLRRRVPADAIYLARYGEGAWNRKFGMYIERDYSNILCGEVWVSDHAQIDVAVAGTDGKPFFPWVTAWRDMKSGKWLGWLLHKEPPKSDHVFQSFYYACRDFGIPKHIYIDNGKDYRAKDFAGGRTKAGKLTVHESSARSMCSLLGLDIHFALPYNAQAKNIERDFLKIKESFSKHVPGYRGGHTKERPEALSGEIRRGKILGSGEFAALLSVHVFHNLNRAPSQGKTLKGLCPDEIYEGEAQNAFVAPEALSILCMRISGSRAIGRNGVKDSRSKETYFAEWMLGQKGRKVYLRRDPSDIETAWVFAAETDEYLGKGYRVEGIPAIVVGEEEREMLAGAMADKRAARKIAKAYASDVREIPPLEKVANMAVGNALLSGYEPPSTSGNRGAEVKKYPMTDAVFEQEQRSALDGGADYSAVAPLPRRLHEKIYQSKADREREEAEKKLLEEERKNGRT